MTEQHTPPVEAGDFTTTHWSVVLSSGDGSESVARQASPRMKRSIRMFPCLALATLAALQARGASFEVGPGQTYTNLAGVPWATLAPGDQVNIHYQPGGYHEVIQLSNSGASGAPILLSGIPDPVTGALPVLDGDRAFSAVSVPWRDVTDSTLGVLVVSRAANTPLGYLPSWIVIQNLHVQNADPGLWLTQSDGPTNSFAGSAAGIYVEYGQHITVTGCEISGCANGFFCGCADNSPFELSAEILVERCWIHDNGYPGEFSAGSINTEAQGLTLQYNLIGPLRPGADGDHITARSSGTVIRYNEIIVAPNGGAAFWIQQTRNAVGILDADPAYGQTYVYGNVFYNPPQSASTGLFYYDSLYVNGPPRNGTLYFYNNTVVNHADQSARYGVGLFALPTLADEAQWGMHDTVDCRNNIFAALPATPGANPSLITLLSSDDSNLVLGTNWFSPGFQWISLPWLSTNFFGTLTGSNATLVGPQLDPGFTDVGATNFVPRSGSPAIDAAGPQAQTVAAGTNAVFFTYAYPTGSAIRVINGLAADLGAFEGVSTNTAGQLHSLTVNHGLGGGAFGAAVVVPLLANPPPAGQVFANWSGFAVDNGTNLGTTLTMPATDVAVTAVYTNAPPPIYYTLTVSNGFGSGAYVAGSFVTISVGNLPSGTAFAGWSGFPVFSPYSPSTELAMPASNLTVTATFTNVPAALLFPLTVVNGSGGGSYVAGATITITAVTPGPGQAFAGWTGYGVADDSALSTTLVMPSAPVTVAATYVSTRPLPSALPRPVTSHPHLWITTNDVPRLRQWAIGSNPIYQQGFLPLLQKCLTDYETQFFPGGAANAS